MPITLVDYLQIRQIRHTLTKLTFYTFLHVHGNSATTISAVIERQGNSWVTGEQSILSGAHPSRLPYPFPVSAQS
jgi:hypothetical protein